jgi:hypothetical protein
MQDVGGGHQLRTALKYLQQVLIFTAWGAKITM